MALRFILQHRVIICPREEVTTLVMLCQRLNLQMSEISRNEGEVMVMMSDKDVQILKEYNDTNNIVPGSWDGE